jgi:hypothetical protein
MKYLSYGRPIIANSEVKRSGQTELFCEENDDESVAQIGGQS